MRQRGQALLLVLVFLAVFLLVSWAGLTLAGGAFLAQGSVQTDTRNTYALDGGVAFAMEYMDLRKGKGCSRPQPPPLTLAYPGTTITVNVTVAKKSCGGGSGVFDVTVTTLPVSRTLNAEITQASGSWSITSQGYQ